MGNTFTFIPTLLLAPLAAFAFGTEAMAATVRTLDGDGWQIATDPKNEGREAKWFVAPREEAKPTKVPWMLRVVVVERELAPGDTLVEESFASWPMQDSPELAKRWERSISELIRRDRNHPSVVIWGLLNEVRDTPHFRLAAASLPLVRKLDPTRMVFLNSGRWDLAGVNEEVFSKLDIWHSPAGREPWATLNPSAQPVQTPFNFTWPPRQVALHPGPRGQYSVVRWTAPAADRYSIAATFTGLFKATTDVYLLHNGRSQFAKQLNMGGSPNKAMHTSELALANGDTIDFVVGWGNGNYGSDSTALTATIKSTTGKSTTGRVFDLAADFPREKNPAGPWSCGWLAPGHKPDPATFALYTESRYKSRPRQGSLANPGSIQWEDVLTDRHSYPRVPHTAATIQGLRNLTGGNLPLFLSEYGGPTAGGRPTAPAHLPEDGERREGVALRIARLRGRRCGGWPVGPVSVPGLASARWRGDGRRNGVLCCGPGGDAGGESGRRAGRR